MGSRALRLFALLTISLTTLAAAENSDQNPALSPISGASPDYILQPADLIRVVFYQDHDMDTEARLGRDGVVSLPLIQSVKVGGRTVLQAQELIRELYDRDYLVNPQIGLSVIEYSKVSVNVLGAVGAPGPVELPTDQPLNLVDAITRAGGFTRLADRRHVKLTRLDKDGGVSTNDINVDDIIKGSTRSDWTLQKGDVIYIPERLL